MYPSYGAHARGGYGYGPAHASYPASQLPGAPIRSTSAVLPAGTSLFQIGEQVEAQWGRHGGDSWFPAIVAGRNADGTFMVDWQDGNTHGRRKRPEEIRKLGSKGTGASEVSSTRAASSVASTPSSVTSRTIPAVQRTSSKIEYHGGSSPLDTLERSQPSAFMMGPSSPRALNAGTSVNKSSLRNLAAGRTLDVATRSSVSIAAEPVATTRPVCPQSPQMSSSDQGQRRLVQQGDVLSPRRNPAQQSQPQPQAQPQVQPQAQPQAQAEPQQILLTQKQQHVLPDPVPVDTTPRAPPQPHVSYAEKKACHAPVEATAEVPAEAVTEAHEREPERPKPRDDVRCFAVELENGEKGVVVQSIEGKRWRFQRSSIDFELAADATALKEWLAGIKDQQFPGLLTLLAGEVTDRGGDLKSLEKERDALRGTEDYDFFGLDGAECTDKDVERAYRKKSMQLHPDKGGDEESFDDMRKKFEQIMELRGESKRKEGGGSIKWDPNSRESMMQAHSDLREQLIWISKHIEETDKEVKKLQKRQQLRRTLTDA